MPVISIDEEQRPSLLSDYAASKSEVFTESFKQAFADNPATKLYQWSQKQNDHDMAAFEKQFPDAPKTKRYTKEEALAYARDKGADLKELPDGLSQPVLDMLSERSYQKKRRSELLNSNTNSGGVAFGGALAGSLVDPINIAVSLIPFVGEARYAGLLANAGSAVGRVAVRAGVGAIEGAAGQAMIEPLNYGLSKSLGDDYSAMDSFMNVATGAAMGSVIHVGKGALGFDPKLHETKTGGGTPDNPTVKFTEPTELSAHIQSMSPEARGDMLKASLAQSLEGKHIDVAPVAELHEAGVAKQVEALQVKAEEARARGEVEAAALYEKRATELGGPTQFDEAASTEKLQTKNAELPDSALIDDKLIKDQTQELAASREATVDPNQPEARLKVEEERTTEAVSQMKEQFKNMGLDEGKILEKADENIKIAAEHEKALNVMAMCALRGER